MKAAYLNERTGPEGLRFGEVPDPRPKAGEVLIEVRATAVTPTEFSWSPTFSTPDGHARPFPVILSHEFSGVISQLGKEAHGHQVGDEVYGMNDWFVNGAQAQFCVAPSASVALKPASLDHTTSAVVPISGLTAWQGLFERCRLKRGERVLIHGGAGGVGLFAVQLARWIGAYVLATASTSNVDFVRSLGADEVIDYKQTRFETQARDMDVVFDTIGGETLVRSWDLLRLGGRLTSIASQTEALKDPRSREAFFIVEPNPQQLTELSRLLQAGTLHAFVDSVFELERAPEAYAQARRGGLRGKVALDVKSGPAAASG